MAGAPQVGRFAVGRVEPHDIVQERHRTELPTVAVGVDLIVVIGAAGVAGHRNVLVPTTHWPGISHVGQAESAFDMTVVVEVKCFCRV